MILRNKRLLSEALGCVLSLGLLIGMTPVDLLAAEQGTVDELVLEEIEPLTEEEDQSNPETPAPKEEQQETSVIEVNQGVSLHTGLNDGVETYMKSFVANKQTVIMMKIPGSDGFSSEQDAKNAVADYKFEAHAVVNGQVQDNCELTAAGSDISIKRAFTVDCEPAAGWYAVLNFPKGPDKGTYNLYMKSGDKEIGKTEGVSFYETKSLNILVVPVKGYWSKACNGGAPAAGAYSCKDGQYSDPNGNKKDWSTLCTELKSYLLDVYPIADVNFEETKELDASDPSYDMVVDSTGGQKKLWEEACKLQSKTKDGKNRYDLILAFVQYRQDEGTGQGYTFGRPTNIITYSDVDMLPTVAHEIAHCYQVGDEYDGGSFNNSVNYAPNGYKGRNFVTGENMTSSGANDYWDTPATFKNKTSGALKNKIDTSGAGTMVKLSLHPYSLSQQKFIAWGGVNEEGSATADQVGPTITYMGSGFSGCDGYYWTSSVIWDHLFKELAVKEKKDDNAEESESESAESEEVSNAEVYLNSLTADGDVDENSIFDEDDFYYDDDIRFGASRLVEVYGWLVKDSGKVKAELNPLFSYDGDLEYIEPIEDIYKDSADVYTFAALDNEGKIIISPVDKKPAVKEFYGGFYNPGTKKGQMQNEINFSFDAEYPVGTSDFCIIKGKVEANGSYTGEVVWQASKDDNFYAEFDKSPECYLSFADVNSEYAQVAWDTYYPEGSSEPYDNKDNVLYTEVYYCPEGDDGQAYYVRCSDDEDWEEGYIEFDTDAEFPVKWTRNAYVWIKVTNGVNSTDVYSDANDVTLCNSTIDLSGAGINKSVVDGKTVYTAYCTGNAITPATDVKVYDPATEKYIKLKKDVDYTVKYSDNVNVGYASVSVQGIGAYAGKNTQEFEIVKKPLSGTPGSIPDMKYSAGLDANVQKYLTVKDGSSVLVYNTDFTVKYTAGDKTETSLAKLIKEAPAEKVTVTVSYFGKGGYTGENKGKTVFNVLPADAQITELNESNTTVTLKTGTAQYSGKELKPAVKSVIVKDAEGKETALKSSDYSVVYSNNTEPGIARVTVIGKNSYTGSAFATFEIAPKQITSISVSGVSNKGYTGTKIDVNSLPITVKAGGTILRKGIDYTVEEVAGADYTNVTTKEMKKAGKAPQVVIKLISTEEAKEAKKKSSEYPKVEWSAKVKDDKKIVNKSFAIVKTKLSSALVSLAVKNKDESKNIVKYADGTVAGTIRSATRDEIVKDKNKYEFVITGTADALGKNADISEGAVLKAFGKDIQNCSVSVSPVKDGKIGTIKFKASKDGAYTGNKTVKFLYCKAAAEEPEEPEAPEEE